MMIAGGLMAGVMLAGAVNQVSVTLPHSVVVGSTTLPSGQYTISSLNMGDGEEYFVVRGNGAAVTLPAQKIDADPSADSTHILFSQEGSDWRFDKMYIKGLDTGFQFVNQK